MKNISDHAHPMHKGPHHDKFIHPMNKGGLEVHMGEKGSHELGDKSHLSSLMGEPKGADVDGHHGKMSW